MQTVTRKQRLLEPVVGREARHPYFRTLLDDARWAPARTILEEEFAAFPNPEGNFVRDFQTTSFDARLWELYIFAVGRHSGFTIERPFESPDFLFRKGDESVWIEAVTANPPVPSSSGPVAGRDFAEEFAQSIPIRLGSPLFSKLKLRYWDLSHVRDTPLVIAIGDFHQTDAIRTSSAPLEKYLYGLDDASRIDERGNLILGLEDIREHRDGKKVIPSNFFGQTDAEFISAVMFSNHGTLPKFNRMGYEAGDYPDIWMARFGVAYSFDAKELVGDVFAYEVSAPDKPPEEWREAVTVFFNPRAVHPVSRDFFKLFGRVWYEDGRMENLLPAFHPIWSVTVKASPMPDLRSREAFMEQKVRELQAAAEETRKVFLLRKSVRSG
jgi:hypothetical protein